MDQQQWKQINSIVDTALDLDKKARQDYINEQCGEDPKLKIQITKLLKSIEKSDTEDFLEGSESYPHNLIADLSNRSDNLGDKPALVGKTIHRYKITKLIGHGGMGSVFLAKRADKAYRKKVAIKVLRRGMDTPTNIARFKRERNILAKLDHPNIARLLDGGMTKDRLPYLVMEYIEGTPLYTYCDEQRLSLEDRLDLFKSICSAVQHAHNNAVIHRDLKPSNILVTEERQVKILDFGIAKLLESEDLHTRLFETQTGARILTPGYAAPEQINNEHITTATDTYTLGTLLYKLLAGFHPFEIEGKDLSEIEEFIRKRSPEKPSGIFRKLSHPQQKQIAERRSMDSSTLAESLTGDIDAIILKTLRKEPERRYNSAEQLLGDIDRRNKNMPIIAHEDSFRYKFFKFIKRHKTAFATVAGFLLLIFSFISFYTWKITKERNRAQFEAEKAQQVSGFLAELFQANNPDHNPQKNISAATLLNWGKQRINKLNNQPEVQARLSGIIGNAYAELGRYKEAKPLIDQSLEWNKEVHGYSSMKYADALQNMGILQDKMGNYAKAESLHRKELNIQKSAVKRNPIKIAETLNHIGVTLYHQDKFQAADSLYRRALELTEKDAHTHRDVISDILSNRASIMRDLDNMSLAKQLGQKVLKMRKKYFGDLHPKVATSYNNLALTLKKLGKLRKADSLYRHGLYIDREIYEGAHPKIATTLYNLGLLYEEQEQYKQAKSYLVKALDLEQQLYRENHPSMSLTFSNLASILRELGELNQAEDYMNRALNIQRNNFGDIHPKVAASYNDLALILKKQGRYIEADSLYRKRLEISNQLHDEPNSGIAVTTENLGSLYKTTGQYKRAESYFSKALNMWITLHDIPHHQISEGINDLAQVYSEIKDTEKILPLLKKALEFNEQSFEGNNTKLAHIKIILGNALITAEDYSNSEILLTEGYQLLKEQNASQNYIEKAQNYLFELYEAWGKPELADQYGS